MIMKPDQIFILEVDVPKTAKISIGIFACASIITFLFLFAQILTNLLNIKAWHIIGLVIIGLCCAFLIRILLWYLFGKEIIIRSADAITIQQDFKIGKSSKKEFFFDQLVIEFKDSQIHDENKGYLKLIFDHDVTYTSSVKASSKKLKEAKLVLA